MQNLQGGAETLGPFLPTALQVAQKFQSYFQSVNEAQGQKQPWLYNT